MIRTPIKPIRAVAEDADCIVIQRASFDPLPSFNVLIGKYTPAVPAVPATPAIPQKSGPNRPDYVPAVPATPGTPEVPDNLDVHKAVVVTMTQEEWDNWKDQNDDDYVRSIMCERLGLTPTA